MIHWALQAHAGWATPPPGRTPLETPHPRAGLTAGERARLEGLRVPQRRADWLLGRTAAKSVVARALRDSISGEWPPEALEIASAPSGMPYARLAPEAEPIGGFRPGERLPVSVTISHTAGHALCAATWTAPSGGPRERWELGGGGSNSASGAAPAQALGADLGVVEPRSRELLETFFTESEQRWVRSAPWWERDLRSNLVWCAKEAVLKALGVGLTVDTRALECRLEQGHADPVAWPMAPAGDGAWRPLTATCGPELLPDGGTVHGIWRAFPGFVGVLASWAGGSR
jgi:phosphopantetheinyl transferase